MKTINKLCYVTTIPATVRTFLKPHIELSSKSLIVKVISSQDENLLLSDIDVEYIPVSVERKISPWKDLLALTRLVLIFQRERFDIVHSIMPKTGLLAMCAAWLTRVPNRVHTFTGQIWATKRGVSRSFFKLFDKLIVFFATHILIDSFSQRDFLVSEGILRKNKGIVIGNGSICGVDGNRFHPDLKSRQSLRNELNIGPNQIVILYVGRLNRDKGILDLAISFANIAAFRNDITLILVGAEENVYFKQVQDICGLNKTRLHNVSFTATPERYMAAADIFCLPSYREGFGQVIIEAGATGLPTVATRIYGVTDAIEDGIGGLLYPAGDIEELTRSLLKLIDDRDLRNKMGSAARARVLALFSSQTLAGEMIKFYTKTLSNQ